MENKSLEIQNELKFVNEQINYWQIIAKLDQFKFELSCKTVDSLVEKKRFLVEKLKELDIEYLN